MNFDFRYYRSVFWRRFPYFVVIVAFFTSIGVTLAIILPPEYEARATLLVESAQIPDELAASTVRTDAEEQLQIIEQRLLTRRNMLDTAGRLDVFVPENRADMSATETVQEMRARTTIRSSSGRNSATLMTIAFRAARPNLAAEVVNEYVTLILQENVEMRTARAGDTLEFFEQEVERLGGELDAQSARILEFQTSNSQALPESGDYLRERQTTIEERVVQIERELATLRDQRVRVIEIFERTGALEETDAPQLSPEEQALNQAKQDLDNALLIYSEQNPRVKLLKSRVAQLEARVNTSAANPEPVAEEAEPADDSARALLNSQLSQLDRNMQFLDTEKARIQTELLQVQDALSQLPSNSITLDKLERDHNNVQAQYNLAIDRLSKAATGERIELLAKGQRIAVIEQATAPDEPTKPNRPLIAGAGAGLGLLFGIGMVLLLELANRSIRRPVELTDKLGITPIAVLPYLRTDNETKLRRFMVFAVLLVLLVLLPLLLFTIHTLYLPLDGIVEPFANRLGFSVSNQ